MRRGLVTGGSGTIGAAICRRLAGAGLAVVVHYHRGAAAAEALAGEIGGRAIGFDLAEPAAVAEALAALLAEGPIQVLVHNAGIHIDAPLAGMRAAQWREVIAVSLDGFFAVTQPLLLPMLATRFGRIVAIASVSALLGNRGQTNYAAAKAGLIGAVRSLSREVASRGVTVNAVAPGIIASPAVDAVMDARRIAEIVPMKRAGTPAEVAAVVGFLASAEAGYISGQTIAVDGGMT